MRKDYFSLAALLAVAFIAFTIYSCTGNPDSVKEGENTLLKKSELAKEMFTPPEKKAAQEVKEGAAKDAANYRRDGSVQLDTTSQRILLLGDSMLEGLGPRLAAYAKANGHTLNYVIWYSSTTEIWGRTEKIKEYIEKYNPTFVFISLGGNELFVSDIKEKRRKYVENMLSQIGDLPYVWIGPPNWKPDTGINDLTASLCAPGCFYLSYTPDQHYDRAKDGAHPTHPSAAAWMDRVCNWVMTKSAHPIRLNKPEPGMKARADHVEVLQPATS